MEGSPSSRVLDRAQWDRFKTTGDRCLVCGNKSIVLSSIELTGDKGGAQLARDKVLFCNEHGLQRYGAGLRAVQTGSANQSR